MKDAKQNSTGNCHLRLVFEQHSFYACFYLIVSSFLVVNNQGGIAELTTVIIQLANLSIQPNSPQVNVDHNFTNRQFKIVFKDNYLFGKQP